jgi:hypothetical protein
MIAVAVAVIIGVVAVTCGIVADSNHPDSLAFLGVMVRTTAAQIFLAGAICTWALFAALWLLSAGIRRSRERGVELKALRAAAAGLTWEEATDDAKRKAATRAEAGTEAEAGPGLGSAADCPEWPAPTSPRGGLGGPGHGATQGTQGTQGTTQAPDGRPDTGETTALGGTAREASASPDSPPSQPATTTPDHSQGRTATTTPDGSPRQDAAPTTAEGWRGRVSSPGLAPRATAPDLPPAGFFVGPVKPGPDLLGFPNTVPGAGFSSSPFPGFDPFRALPFAASSFFDHSTSDDQSTSDRPASAHDLADSAHAAPDLGGAVLPGSGRIGPALTDRTSPAAGLDGVDPRRARKPLSE